MRIDDLVQDLKQIRDKCLESKLASAEITELLTNKIVDHFQQQGLGCNREFRILAEYSFRRKSRSSCLRYGRIDLVIQSKMEWAIAVEIDRGNKKWSVDKLKCFQKSNPESIGVWIRWGGHIRNVDTSDIVLINLTTESPQIVWPQSGRVA